MKAVLYSNLMAIALMAAGPTAQAAPSAACAYKQQEIETQLGFAKQAGNQHQIAGLERALAANQTHCSDASLEQERQERITKAAHKVAEREQELAEAQAKGDPKKVARRQSKLLEAQHDLQEAQRPLPQ